MTERKFVVFFNNTVGYYNFTTYESFVKKYSDEVLDYDCYTDVEQAVDACQRNNKRINKASTKTKIDRYLNLADYQDMADSESLDKTTISKLG